MPQTGFPHAPEERPDAKRESHRRRFNLFKAGFILLIAANGAACAANPGAYRFLDRVDLVSHEAGHPLFGIFGELIGILREIPATRKRLFSPCCRA